MVLLKEGFGPHAHLLVRLAPSPGLKQNTATSGWTQWMVCTTRGRPLRGGKVIKIVLYMSTGTPPPPPMKKKVKQNTGSEGLKVLINKLGSSTVLKKNYPNFERR